MRKHIVAGWILSIVALLAPQVAIAHGGPADAGLVSGLAHPFGGADHLLAMLAVGLWAGLKGGRGLWLLPATFVAGTALGGVLGWTGMALPMVEGMLALSVLVFGLLIVAAARLPLSAAVVVAGGFALFHGHAHGAELPMTAAPLLFGAGVLAATAALHAAGVLLVRLGLGGRLARLGGLSVAGYGVMLLAGA